MNLHFIVLKYINVVAAAIKLMIHMQNYVFLMLLNDIKVKVFSLMPRTNETRHIKWNETCKCKCRLDTSVCNNKQHWNNDKCRCECKELIDNGRYYKGFIWNLSECECDKLCDVEENLDYKNCKYRKRLIDKLVEEWIENINNKKLHSNKMIYDDILNAIPLSATLLNDYEKMCRFCTVYLVLLVIFFMISISISSVFIYFHWYLKRGYTETAIC